MRSERVSKQQEGTNSGFQIPLSKYASIIYVTDKRPLMLCFSHPCITVLAPLLVQNDPFIPT